MPTWRSWKTGHKQKWRPCKVRWLVSKSVYAPSANQSLSTSKPRHDHTVCTLQVHPPPPVPPFLLMQHKSQGLCRKWHNEAESLMTSYEVIGQESVKALDCKVLAVPGSAPLGNREFSSVYSWPEVYTTSFGGDVKPSVPGYWLVLAFSCYFQLPWWCNG